MEWIINGQAKNIKSSGEKKNYIKHIFQCMMKYTMKLWVLVLATSTSGIFPKNIGVCMRFTRIFNTFTNHGI